MEKEEFILVSGPMMASKSKYLIDNYYGKDIEAYKPDIDNRDGNFIKSRNYIDKKIPCTRVSKLAGIQVQKPIVIIDEHQFFETEDLKNFVLKCKKEHKKIVLAGLDRLASGEYWTNYTEMKKLCDKEIKLKARCSVCNKPAEYTKMTAGDPTKAVQIEGEAKYEPMCKEHYFDR